MTGASPRGNCGFPVSIVKAKLHTRAAIYQRRYIIAAIDGVAKQHTIKVHTNSINLSEAITFVSSLKRNLECSHK